MEVHELIPGVLVFQPKVFRDARGSFFVSFNPEKYAAAGLDETFTQDNLAHSSRGVLRGLHYQDPNGQGKLVMAASGIVIDVAVDLREDSSTFGHHIAVELNAELGNQVYIPRGFAHGYYVVSEHAIVHYKCTDVYSPADEKGVRWNDPMLDIQWKDANPTVNERDSKWPLLADSLSAEAILKWRKA